MKPNRTSLLTPFWLALPLALLLAAAGIYATTRYTLGRRARELGIRMALGARSGQMMSMILKQTAKLIFLALATGVLGALAVARGLNALVFGITPTDPVTFTWVTGFLGLVALLAAYMPVRRILRMDPLRALRVE